MLLNKLAITAAILAAASGAFAVELTQVDKSFVLKDGSTVYIFKNGKMAMEDKLGRVVPMKQGELMQTTDGQRIVMLGNELARLEWVRKTTLGGGK